MTGSAAVLATVGTLAAAGFAAGAYNAAVQSVAETRRQADTAQEQLVASTRARLKITSIKDMRVGPVEVAGTGVSLTMLSVVAAYKNFGQSPAQNIFLFMRVFVIGTGPSPRETCERQKAKASDHSLEIVFPQDEEGGKMYGIPVLPDELEAQAAEARAARPGLPVELAVVGCLTYRSTNSDAVHVTGIHGELHRADAAPAGRRGRPSTFKAVVDAGGSAAVGLKLHALGAWAD